MPEYRDIEGHPGYRIGDDGSVWTLWIYRVATQTVLGTTWRPVKQTRRKRGHMFVHLRNRSKGAIGVHALVLRAFVGPCPEGMQCCHYDGDASNNRIGNLRWGTAKDNAADRIRHGRQVRGEQAPGAKLTDEQVREIKRLIGQGVCDRKLALRFGVGKSNIRRIAQGKAWSHVEPKGAVRCGTKRRRLTIFGV